MSRQNVDLGSGSVGKLLFSLAVPTITSQIVNMLYNLVDRVYIGHMQPVETVGKLALTLSLIHISPYRSCQKRNGPCTVQRERRLDALWCSGPPR